MQRYKLLHVNYLKMYRRNSSTKENGQILLYYQIIQLANLQA
ncbi:Uncharacterised protein [Enterobacter hormaechei]|nr:Uncharacterised protein [Enterobacter hormaechei]